MWFYNDKEVGEEDLEGNVAFVYLITNLTNNKRYVGKKLLAFTRTKKVKGQTRKKKVKTESDWKSYYGSNKTLQEDVERLGQEHFRREILRFCKTKGTANYWEAYEIMIRGAIISDDYYNEWLHVKVSRSQVKE